MKKFPKIHQVVANVRESRRVECGYYYYCDNEKDAQEIKEKLEKGEIVPPDDVMDFEVIDVCDEEVTDVEASVVEDMAYYPFVRTENGYVTDFYEELGERGILEILRREWEGMSDEEKELQPWDEVEEELSLAYFNKYGDKIVYQAIKG